MTHKGKKRSVSGTAKKMSSTTPEAMENTSADIVQGSVSDLQTLTTMFTQMYTSVTALHTKFDMAMDNIKRVELDINNPDTC